MRRFQFWCAVSVVGVATSGQTAAAQFHRTSSQQASDNVGTPDTLRGWSIRNRTTAHADQGHNPQSGDQGARPDSWGHRGRRGHHHHHNQGGDNAWIFWLPGYPLLGNVGYTRAFGTYDSGYPYTVQRGFSVWSPNRAAVAAPNNAAPNNPAPAPNDPPPVATKKPKIRATNASAKARAGRFIGYGDANFRKQVYLSAVERYKTAARVAPDVAETYFRQGFGFVAMGNYPSAARAFRRGLAVRADWIGSPFRLDQIYGDNQIAKTAHLESLAMAVDANPLDADLLMLLGLQVFFDGQAARSEVFFVRAAQLGGNEDRLLDRFLPQPGPAGAGKPQPGPKPGDKLVF
jgi:hypothetical protein